MRHPGPCDNAPPEALPHVSLVGYANDSEALTPSGLNDFGYGGVSVHGCDCQWRVVSCNDYPSPSGKGFIW